MDGESKRLQKNQLDFCWMWSNINKVLGKSCLNVRKWIGHHYAQPHTSSLQASRQNRLPSGWIIGTPCPGIMVKPDPFALTISKHKKVQNAVFMPFLHFLAGDLLLPIETWKPLRLPPEKLLPFLCCFLLQLHSWPSQQEQEAQ